MIRAPLSITMLVAFLAAGCAADGAFEDRSDQVKIVHRIPSK